MDKDEDGIRHNIPNTGFEKWQHNKYGFRGPEYEYRKPQGVIRVVTMGTSETYGGCESPGMEWPGQLAAMLENVGRFQVINPSVAGLRFKEYVPYLQKRVSPFDPDLVVIVFNPVTYFVNLDRWPNFKPTPRREQTDPVASPAGGGISIETIKNNIRLFPKIKQVLKKFLPQAVTQRIQLRSAKREAERMEAEYLKEMEPRQSIPDVYVDSLHNLLGDMITDIQRSGSDVVLTTYPTLLSADNKNDYPSIFLENQRFYVELTLDGMIDAAEKYRQMLPELCKEYGIDYIDLESRVPKSPDYFCDNVHYYDNAADSVATAVAEYLTHKYRSVVSASVAAPSP
jgi:hypothetical protein